MNLSGVAENGGTIADKQEVERRSNDKQIAGRFAGYGAIAPVFDVEFTSAGHVDVAGRLEYTGVQAEGNHVSTDIGGRHDILSTVSVRGIRVVEHGGHFAVDINTVDSDA